MDDKFTSRIYVALIAGIIVIILMSMAITAFIVLDDDPKTDPYAVMAATGDMLLGISLATMSFLYGLKTGKKKNNE